ncbi:unnamed protein product [Cochlearia groenlandica]
MLNLMLTFLLRRLQYRRRKSGDEVVSNSSCNNNNNNNNSGAAIHPKPEKAIRVGSFNAAMFSMAPAVPNNNNNMMMMPLRSKSTVDRPRSILKQHNSSLSSSTSRRRVSINLPDNEIDSTTTTTTTTTSHHHESSSPIKPAALSFSGDINGHHRSTRSALEVLMDLNADVLALQDVKADESDHMRPLSDLATSLGMYYVFAESWAPEYGNAILSKWPIQNSSVHNFFDHSDFRNVLKATIEVPGSGEVEFHCTQLDHLDENWRMKQVDAIIQSSKNAPHILAGALNSLDQSDYSPERWTHILKYYQYMGKPIPKSQVMRFFKSKDYTDAKDFAGECESVVVVAKGQSVQGTCKYGTRVDYILASSDSPYKFVPGSYSVLSSKGTSDHHIVKVDVVVNATSIPIITPTTHHQIVKTDDQDQSIYINNPSLTKPSWRTHYYKA